MFLDSAARRLWHFFARQHHKYRRENKTQVQFRAEQSAKARVSAHASKEIDTPRAAADARAAKNNNSSNYNNKITVVVTV